MAGVIFSKTTAGLSDGDLARIGKIATPLKMIMKEESDLLAKEKGIADWLYNIEKSDVFAESVVAQSGLGLLYPTEDGGRKQLMSYKETVKTIIEHFEYSGKFVATAAMLEDSIPFGKPSSQMAQHARMFIRAYYQTRNYLAANAITSGTGTTFKFRGVERSIACGDGEPLFSNAHKYGPEGDTQSNLLYNVRGSGVNISASMIADILGECAVRMEAMRDEDGNPMGYIADTIIVPQNNRALRVAVLKACGSELTSNSTGAASNDINVQVGNWNVIALPIWQLADPTDCPMIIMSSKANKELGGNMFYDRIPFTVEEWRDHDTSNYCMSGRTRIGIGFGTYKHAIFFESLANGGSTLFDGQTAASVGTSVTI